MQHRKRLSLVLATTAAVGIVVAALTIAGSSHDDTASYFSDDDTAAASSSDPSRIDVLVLVPDSAHADADQRLITEAIGMWQGGIGSLADEPDLGWLQDADFQVTADALGAQPTYSLRDPEIVIIAATPPGRAGAGATPSPVEQLEIYDADDVLCDTVTDPFAFATWSQNPGFRSHRSLPEGTYVQDCGGAGGTVCFAINATLDPSSTTDVFDTFGLVSDEFGHCLTRGPG